VIRRKVIYDADANADFFNLFNWIARSASARTAATFMARLEARISRLDLAAERGTARDDIEPGLRIVPIDERVLVAIKVYDAEVVVLRVFYGGQDWEAVLRHEGGD